MAKEATKSQTKHVGRMILPSSSQNTCKCTLEYCVVEKQVTEKVHFHHLSSSSFFLSHTKL